MNVRINQLVKSLLQKDSIEQCSIQELQLYADRHPYFGAAQLLLAKKMKAENNDLYNEQLQKTYLFFHNPLWVEALLNETGNAIITRVEKPVIEKIETPVVTEPIVAAPEAVIPTPVVEEAIITAAPVEENIAPVSHAEVADEEPLAEESSADEAPLNIPTLKLEAFDPSKTELSFEPFHTVDYFASQGIKFREEEKPQDKLGRDLKKFTEWLKVMKRIPASELGKNTSAATEQKVEQMAAHSVEPKEVLTETMAEVWEKQGNKAKATEIYTKLSLLEPSKSAYFAAKIEDLKKTN